MITAKSLTTIKDIHIISFGVLMTAERKARKMTQAELAQKLGVTQSCISKAERDLNAITFKTGLKFMKLFKISIKDMENVVFVDTETMEEVKND